MIKYTGKPYKDENFYAGVRFDYGHDTIMLVRTSDYKDKDLIHFQLVSLGEGNRWSNTVVTHNMITDSPVSITYDELLELLEYDPIDHKRDIELFLRGRIHTDMRY